MHRSFKFGKGQYSSCYEYLYFTEIAAQDEHKENKLPVLKYSRI